MLVHRLQLRMCSIFMHFSKRTNISSFVIHFYVRAYQTFHAVSPRLDSWTANQVFVYKLPTNGCVCLRSRNFYSTNQMIFKAWTLGEHFCGNFRYFTSSRNLVESTSFLLVREASRSITFFLTVTPFLPCWNIPWIFIPVDILSQFFFITFRGQDNAIFIFIFRDLCNTLDFTFAVRLSTSLEP